MHSASLFTNPYAIEVLRTKKEELVEGIKDPDRLLNWLIDNGIFTPEKKMVMSFYRTRTQKNSRVLDILISQGERACRLFFYPCLKQVEPKLYSKIRKYISEIDVKDKKGRTPLHGAAEKGHGDAVKMLLKEEARSYRNQRNFLHMAALKDESSLAKIAVQENLHGIVAALIDRGTDINAYNEMQYTPLLLACETGKAESAEVLIEKGADFTNVNVKDKESKTPLHFAAERGDKAMVEMLLNANADPNAQDKEKKTPLHTAAVRGHLGIVKVLLANKGRHGAKDMDGCTPMHYAAVKGNIDIIKILLTSGKNKNIDDRNIWRKTALHIAAEYGHSDLINLLLSYGAAINALDSSKDTPLHCACKAGHFNAANSLVNWSQGEKANLLAANSLKKTPLQYYLGLCQLQCCSLSYLEIRKHLPANLCVWGCSALDLLDSLPMLINPIGRLGINQREEQRVPKTLLTRCCFQDTVRCYTDIQYLAGPSLDISVLYPMTWY
uniref:CARD domain-containing protein n=1 Tax=Aquila chrysaetos chrysaetos TaxID=223781 RepID=A0A663FJV8_AQUCH